MITNSVPINFNVPMTIKTRFDGICHLSGKTRTSVLVDLMTNFILSQSELLNHRNRQFDLIDKVLVPNRNPVEEGPLELFGPDHEGNW